MKNFITVEGPTYRTLYGKKNEDLLSMRQIIEPQKKGNEIDVFGHCWSMGMANFKEDFVSVRRGDSLIRFRGKVGVFIPT